MCTVGVCRRRADAACRSVRGAGWRRGRRGDLTRMSRRVRIPRLVGRGRRGSGRLPRRTELRQDHHGRADGERLTARRAVPVRGSARDGLELLRASLPASTAAAFAAVATASVTAGSKPSAPPQSIASSVLTATCSSLGTPAGPAGGAAPLAHVEAAGGAVIWSAETPTSQRMCEPPYWPRTRSLHGADRRAALVTADVDPLDPGSLRERRILARSRRGGLRRQCRAAARTQGGRRYQSDHHRRSCSASTS